MKLMPAQKINLQNNSWTTMILMKNAITTGSVVDLYLKLTIDLRVKLTILVKRTRSIERVDLRYQVVSFP